jgi:hypothetical protein
MIVAFILGPIKPESQNPRHTIKTNYENDLVVALLSHFHSLKKICSGFEAQVAILLDKVLK